MSTKQVAALALARLEPASGHCAVLPAFNGTANGATKGIPGAPTTRMWYPGPERLMSQSERLPS